MPAQQSAEFKKAVEDSRKLKAKPSDDELLKVGLGFGQPTIRDILTHLAIALRSVQAGHSGPTDRGHQGSWHVRAQGKTAWRDMRSCRLQILMPLCDIGEGQALSMAEAG